ncbi:MAG: hypothetical protein IK025_01365 [Bacteroidales bacterium]|nr:hypothetical protein [Bacteroidales bacterium]
MRKFLLLAMCALVSGLAFGQHSYYTYENDDSITTVVMLSDPNNYYTYLVSVNREKNEIAVATMTDNCPQTLVSSSLKNLQLYAGSQYPNIGSLVLNGGFVDNDGDIVVYGAYCNGSNRQGTIVKLYYSSGFSTAKSVMTSAEIVSGCYGFMGTNMKYFFATSDTFFRMETNLSSSINAALKKTINGARDISLGYDYQNNRLIVSGSLDSNSVFLLVYNTNVNTLNGIITNVKYVLPTNAIDSHTTAMSIGGNGYYCDSTAYIFQPLETNNNGNCIWLLKVNYFTGSAYGSYLYNFDNNVHKFSAIAAANNFDYLFLIGDDMAKGKYVASFDMYNLASHTVMSVLNLTHSFANLEGKWNYYDLFLNNMTYDHYTGNVIAGGAVRGTGLVMDAYTVSSCGTVMNSGCLTQSYTTSTVTPIPGSMSINNGIGIDDYRVRPYTLANKCIDCGMKSMETKMAELDELISERQAQYGQEVSKSKPLAEKDRSAEIIIEGNDFICDGFSGLCSYRITDVSGRILKEGKTSCGSRNAIGNYKLGIYVIQVYDEAGNMLSRKILVSEY